MDIRTNIKKHGLRVGCMAIVMLLVLIVLTGIFWGSRHFIVRHHVVFYDNLPEKFDGYKILHFSDLHIGTFRGGREGDVETLVKLINEQNCDAVVFTGDMINRESCELAGMRDVLSQIKAPDGVYSILGNHDYGTYAGYEGKQQEADVEKLLLYQRGFGWTPLLNDHVKIYRGKQSISIAGIENYGMPPFPQKGDLSAALKGLKKSDFIVLLSHDPDFWRMNVLKSSVQLTLSGHTHAAQFKIWGWSPVSWRYNEWSGLYVDGNHVLNVSEGIGGYIGPFRYGAWPEVSIVELRRIK